MGKEFMSESEVVDPEQTPVEAAGAVSTKELNFARLRKEKERLESELKKMKESSVVKEVLKLSGIEDDSWIEAKQLPDILNAFAGELKASVHADMETKLENRFKQYKKDHLFSYMQAETGSHYGRVVTDESLKKLLEKEPEMEIVLEALRENPEKYAQVVYHKCARIAEEEKNLSESKARLDAAAARPGRRYIQPSYAATTDASGFNPYTIKPGDTSAYDYIKNLSRNIRL
jgi:hypothetical protein